MCASSLSSRLTSRTPTHDARISLNNIEKEGGEIKVKRVSGIVSKRERRGRKGGGRGAREEEKEGRKRMEEGGEKVETKGRSWNSLVISVPFGKVRGLRQNLLFQHSLIFDFCVTSSSNRLITEAIRLASHRMSLFPHINSTRTHVPGIEKYLQRPNFRTHWNSVLAGAAGPSAGLSLFAATLLVGSTTLMSYCPHRSPSCE